LLGYSGGLGSIAGVLIADYWIIRKKELRLEDLYLADGVYRGWKWPAILATALGCALAWSGLVISSLRPLYDYAWFVGFITSAVVYVALRPTDAVALARPIDRAGAELTRR
jgi:nucleobase:cation symporter-1, NCS1 family